MFLISTDACYKYMNFGNSVLGWHSLCDSCDREMAKCKWLILNLNVGWFAFTEESIP